jgi:hypothetical protein
MVPTNHSIVWWYPNNVGSSHVSHFMLGHPNCLCMHNGMISNCSLQVPLPTFLSK